MIKEDMTVAEIVYQSKRMIRLATRGLEERVSRELKHEHYVPQRLMLRKVLEMVWIEMRLREVGLSDRGCGGARSVKALQWKAIAV